jgi:heptaprenylglyceryl phosphate synthase
MIVGGGITDKSEIIDLKKAGARFVVLGTILEQNPSTEFISKILP